MSDYQVNRQEDPVATQPEFDNDATVLTSPADVASAGRSCMAILLLFAAILLLLGVWIVYRSVGGGQ